MPYFRILLCMSIALSLWHCALPAQARPASSSNTIPQLGGRWLLTYVVGARPDVVTFVQTGNMLRADLSADVHCAGAEVRMLFTLEGGVDGSSVWLRVISVRMMSGGIDSELADTCSQYTGLSKSAAFRGKLSADRKKIVGPYDYSGSRENVWTFER